MALLKLRDDCDRYFWKKTQITVGGGGSAGVYGTEVEVPGGIDQFGKAVFDIVDQHG